ncbi:MAG TPA: YbhB/YbcL family Raf kinase inhibitor-like protein [Planctomycetaceae bacterium]|nr:YbhB/YbcL family Raf kinase inhibitor-like protein [Planctomycetaceae bacterium]HIQ22534.1 YbhB/YbcL family Raf kinase inhibitor-like protein [Planctomycetota bacterium]
MFLSRCGWGTVFVAPVVFALCGCRPDTVRPEPSAGVGEEVAEEPGSAIQLTSTAFADGQPIPAKYTEDGDDLSPPLAWSNLPEGTEELALICDDPDAPSPSRPAPEPWVHWVIYKIPADTTELAEGIPRQQQLDKPAGAMQGVNSWSSDNIGYRGPAPPAGSGKHRYFFKLYALDAKLDLKPGASKAELRQAMEGHVLGTGQLVGTYQR